MLILTRKVGEKIIIGNDIIIEVLIIGNQQVALGIIADVEVKEEKKPPKGLE